MRKIKINDYTMFAINYAADANNHRLGQAFLNYFYPSLTLQRAETECVEHLFYTENREEAVQIIFDRFVDLGEVS